MLGIKLGMVNPIVYLSEKINMLEAAYTVPDLRHRVRLDWGWGIHANAMHRVSGDFVKRRPGSAWKDWR